jgi:hypothetical protein
MSRSPAADARRFGAWWRTRAYRRARRHARCRVHGIPFIAEPGLGVGTRIAAHGIVCPTAPKEAARCESPPRAGVSSLAHRCVTFAALSLACAALDGCTRDIYLPPARMLPLESAATLRHGEAGIQMEAAGHGAIFGVSATSAAIRVRYGLDGETDISAEGAVLGIHGDDVPNSYPNILAMRVGVKRRLAPWVSVTGGLGGGASEGGGFVSPDVGVVVAYENSHFVPLLTTRAGFSVPFDRQPVVVQVGSAGVSPPLTLNAGGTVGFRIPRQPSAPGAGRGRASLLGGIGVTMFSYGGGTESPQGVVSLAGGAEIVF